MTTRIELFNVGWMTVAAGLMRSGEDMETPVRLPIPAYLVETETERILVDTGLHPDAIADPDAFYGREHALGPFTVEQDQSIGDQIDLSTITRVVLTHLHFDHVGALRLVPEKVPVVLQRAEWEAGHDDAAVQGNFFLPADYAGTERPVELADGDHDLLGDGSVLLLSTPGHTPGHQSVQVGDVVIGGDVTMFANDQRLPAFGDDLAVQAHSAERLKTLSDTGNTVMPGHDPEALVAGPVAPPA